MNDERKDIINELKELAPELARLKQAPNQPTVPDGFFEAMQARVLAEVPPLKKTTPQPKVAGTVRRLAWWKQARFAAAAAALLLLIGVAIWQSTPTAVAPDSSTLLAQLETQEILAYVEANVEDYELQNLSEWYEADDESSLLPEDFLPEGFSDSDLNHLLLDTELEELESFDIY